MNTTGSKGQPSHSMPLTFEQQAGRMALLLLADRLDPPDTDEAEEPTGGHGPAARNSQPLTDEPGR
jgi:hypothetical protein